MKKLILLSTLFFSLLLMSCGGNKQESTKTDPMVDEPVKEEVVVNDMENKGIGPVKSVTISEEIDQDMAAKGEKLFEDNCTACHRPTTKHIGSAPKGVLDRRTPEWTMNMIMNPTEMMQKDPIASRLQQEANGAPMSDMGLTREETRAVLEYFRTL